VNGIEYPGTIYHVLSRGNHQGRHRKFGHLFAGRSKSLVADVVDAADVAAGVDEDAPAQNTAIHAADAMLHIALGLMRMPM